MSKTSKNVRANENGGFKKKLIDVDQSVINTMQNANRYITEKVFGTIIRRLCEKWNDIELD